VIIVDGYLTWKFKKPLAHLYTVQQTIGTFIHSSTNHWYIYTPQLKYNQQM